MRTIMKPRMSWIRSTTNKDAGEGIKMVIGTRGVCRLYRVDCFIVSYARPTGYLECDYD
jgi:hypothetical protein